MENGKLSIMYRSRFTHQIVSGEGLKPMSISKKSVPAFIIIAWPGVFELEFYHLITRCTIVPRSVCKWYWFHRWKSSTYLFFPGLSKDNKQAGHSGSFWCDTRITMQNSMSTRSPKNSSADALSRQMGQQSVHMWKIKEERFYALCERRRRSHWDSSSEQLLLHFVM